MCNEYDFFFSHWEKYNTGVMYLPWGYGLFYLYFSQIGDINKLRKYVKMSWKIIESVSFSTVRVHLL